MVNVKDVPAKFKPVKRYVREAKKLAKNQPVTAYHTWLHAVQLSMKIDKASDDGKKFCIELMDEIEKLKPRVEGDKDDHVLEITEVALEVFDRADADAKNNPSKKTAAMFSTAFVIMEVLTGMQDEPDQEIAVKKKYAMAMVTHILQCIKKGEPITDLPGLKKKEEENALPDAPGGYNPSQPEVKTANDGFNPGPQLDAFGLPIVQPGIPAPAPQQLQPVAPAWSPPPAVKQHSGITDQFERKVIACAKAETALKEAFSSMQTAAFDDAMTCVSAVIARILAPHRGNGNWKPQPMNSNIVNNKDLAGDACVEQLREAHCALRFNDVDCAIAIMTQVMKVLARHANDDVSI